MTDIPAIGRHGQILSQQELDKLLAIFEIPTCPALVNEVMQEARRDEPDIRRLASMIGADVGMSAVTLKVANSPLFRVFEKIDSIQRALQRLGVRNVMSIVLGVALRNTMHGLPGEFVERFWKRSSILAQAAGAIAKKQVGVSSDTAYTYALFHNAAIPLMLRRFPDYEALIEEASQRGESRIQAERQLPCTHPIVGSLMVRNWGLPDAVAQAIRFHHEPDVYELPPEALPGEPLTLIAIGHIAEHLLTDLVAEDDGEVTLEHFNGALRHLQIDEYEIDYLREVVAEVAAEAG